jgi:hypothetical protein
MPGASPSATGTLVSNGTEGDVVVFRGERFGFASTPPKGIEMRDFVHVTYGPHDDADKYACELYDDDNDGADDGDGDGDNDGGGGGGDGDDSVGGGGNGELRSTHRQIVCRTSRGIGVNLRFTVRVGVGDSIQKTRSGTDLYSYAGKEAA